MTDKLQDTQKAAGELQGRARRGQRGREGERAHGTAAPEHTTGAGGRNADGLAPGEQRRRTERSTAAEREQGENGQTEKKEIYKYLRERREKKRR